MGLLSTKPEVRVEKEEANPTYETYGRKGEVDYIVNYNDDYQSSDYDEMYDTVGGRSIPPKVWMHSLYEYEDTVFSGRDKGIEKIVEMLSFYSRHMRYHDITGSWLGYLPFDTW